MCLLYKINAIYLIFASRYILLNNSLLWLQHKSFNKYLVDLTLNEQNRQFTIFAYSMVVLLLILLRQGFVRNIGKERGSKKRENKYAS